MIALQRSGLSTRLQGLTKKWSGKLLQYLLSKREKVEFKDIPGKLKDKYSDEELKFVLIMEAHGKCMYCEDTFRQCYTGDVEHIIPKAVHPLKMYDHDNLGFSCWECNNKKLDAFDPNLRLVNPYEDDPEAHLEFDVLIPGQLTHLTDRGKQTHLQLKLNRFELVEERKRYMKKNLSRIRRLWESTADPQEKAAYWQELLEEGASTERFSLLSRWYVKCLQQGTLPPHM